MKPSDPAADAESTEARAVRKSDTTRERILTAAARIFVEKGYAHTRITDIAEAAGTHAGAIYYYFTSRDDLVQNVLRLSVERVTHAVLQALSALPEGASYRAKITAAIHAHLTHALLNDPFTAAYTRMHNQISPEVRQLWSDGPRKYGNIWRNLLSGAQAAGELRTDLDPTVMRLNLLGAVIWSLEWYRPGKMTPEQIADQLATAFFDGNGTRR